MSQEGPPEDPRRPAGGGPASAAPQPRGPSDRDSKRTDAPSAGDEVGDGRLGPSHLFIRRPIATCLLMVAIFLSGVIGFQFLPLSALPEVDYPTIQVQTFYPGASPEVITSYVTAPLERQFGESPSLNRMSSVSSAGASIITLQFGLDLTLDVAEQEVQAAINAAGNLLPSDLPAPPVYAKVNPADAPILTLALSSKTLPLTQVEDLADTRMAAQISQVAGVGLVSISGGQRPAVRVQANPRALAAYALSLESLRTALSSANVNGSKGSVDGPTRQYTLNANDQLGSTQEFSDLVVAYRNGAPIRLGNVATIINGAENTQLGAFNNVTPSVILNIQRQPGANVIAVVDRIKALMPQSFCTTDGCRQKTKPGVLDSALPPGVSVTPTTDRTVTIRASVSDVEFELMLSVMLVVLVIFLFLRNIAATFISGVSVPLSLVGTFGAMYLLGFSLNNLTLMALTIATGFVVDDAIVMIENISRHLEMGADRRSAAFIGSGEIGFTIISLTLSLLAVLIPLLFMGDVVGRLFREFAVTLAVTIVISAFVSLTLVPSLCALWLGPPQEDERTAFGRFNRRLDSGFQWVLARYDVGLTWVLGHQALTLLLAVATFLVTALLYVIIPKGLFPTQDTGLIQGVSEASQTISFSAMSDHQRQLAEVILKDPDVVNVQSFVGVDGQNQTLNEGRVLISLRPLAQRKASASAVIRRLQDETRSVAGVALYLQPVQDLTIDSNVGRTQYQFVLEGTDQTLLSSLGDKLVTRLKTLPSLEQVSSDTQNQGLSAYIQVDRTIAGRLGTSLAAVDNALYDAFGQRIVSTSYTQSNQYRVILEAAPSVQKSVDALGSIYVQSTAGTAVPLSAIATIREQPSAQQISHVGQFPATTLSFNLAKGVALGTAVNEIKKVETQIGVPISVTTTFLGAAEAFQSSLTNELWLILAAIVAIYIVLGVLYESFVHPLTILSTLPSAAIGALLALLITGQDLGVIGIIGIILLFGIVKKNAIMMIDFALEAERHEGLSSTDAIHRAALLRFRPIMMTTMAALLGALPLMLGGGIGSELRFPLGVAIVGGLLASQLLTLFTTPVIYIAFDGLAARLRRSRPNEGTPGGRTGATPAPFPDPEGYPS